MTTTKLTAMPKTLPNKLAFADTTDAAFAVGDRIVELAAPHPGRYIWTYGDTGHRHQVCAGGQWLGSTLNWCHADDADSFAASLARGIGATRFTTDRDLFNRISAAMAEQSRLEYAAIDDFLAQ